MREDSVDVLLSHAPGHFVNGPVDALVGGVDEEVKKQNHDSQEADQGESHDATLIECDPPGLERLDPAQFLLAVIVAAANPPQDSEREGQ